MPPAEPSVLDYIKAILSFGRDRVPEVPALSAAGATRQTVRDAKQARPLPQAIHLPWRVALAFVLFLIGQTYLPPGQSWEIGILLILAAAAIAIWAAVEGEWRLPQFEKVSIDKKALEFRSIPLALGLLFFGLTFLCSGGGR